jgi:hypothetical protein
VREADDLTTFLCRMSWKSGSLNIPEPSGPHRACYGTALPFFYNNILPDILFFLELLFNDDIEWTVGVDM